MRPRMGVVNWDSIYPSDTYFGASAIYRLGNPKPRIDRPIPWCKYEDTSYAPHPTGEQIKTATLDLFKWMEENRSYVDEKYCVSFAWNEFEEGGYFCPTLSQTGAMNSDTLDGLGRALRFANLPESD